MKLITTSDGSHTLFSEEFNEIYHSRFGALEESLHVYIQSGLQYYIAQHAVPKNIGELKIFEMGFGTGLNALLSLIEAQKHGLSIYYEAVELYPVSIELVKELNYSAIIENEKYRPPYHSMHLSAWGTKNSITPDFTLKKVNASLLDYSPALNSFHLIYYDAFAPEAQPELWTEEIMRKMYDALLPGGVLVTYCSKSTFQRALKAVGFTIQKLPGQRGKREIVRALKS